MKERIENWLISNGFTKAGDDFSREAVTGRREMVVNGRVVVDERKVGITVHLIGEGEDLSGGEPVKIYGYKIMVGRYDAGDIWVYDEKDMDYFLRQYLN